MSDEYDKGFDEGYELGLTHGVLDDERGLAARETLDGIIHAIHRDPKYLLHIAQKDEALTEAITRSGYDYRNLKIDKTLQLILVRLLSQVQNSIGGRPDGSTQMEGHLPPAGSDWLRERWVVSKPSSSFTFTNLTS